METAIEWYHNEMVKFEKGNSEFFSGAEIYNHAFRMEKKQIINFANDFYDDCVTEGGSLNQSAEEYYNEIYQNK